MASRSVGDTNQNARASQERITAALLTVRFSPVADCRQFRRNDFTAS